MEAMNLPIFPMDEDGNDCLVFLPGVETEEIVDLKYEFDPEESVLLIYCIYGENEDGEPTGDSYPVAIGEDEHELVEDIGELMVLGPGDVEPDELTDDAEAIEQLEELFDQLRQIEDEWDERAEAVENDS